MGVLAIQAGAAKLLNVGGQAVIEGVMMRSPNSFAVCVRAPDGKIVLREDRWQSVWKKMKFLRWPFLRGVIVLIESLWNGVSSLSFSAKWAALEEDAKKEPKEGEAEAKPLSDKDSPLSDAAMAVTILISFAFAMGLFVVLPHALTALAGFDVNSFSFHALDGVIKVLILILYIWGIGFMPQIKRVFQYHGAEHMSISAYENNLPLTVENARKFTTFHPRCGTSFLFFVLIISMIVFAIIFPFLPAFPGMNKIVKNIILIAIKIPLMMPIAGLSYEFIKLAGKYSKNPFLSFLSKPGLWMQRLTTRPPTDDMLEVALLSLRKCLWREQTLANSPQDNANGAVDLYNSFDDALQSIH